MIKRRTLLRSCAQRRGTRMDRKITSVLKKTICYIVCVGVAVHLIVLYVYITDHETLKTMKTEQVETEGGESFPIESKNGELILFSAYYEKSLSHIRVIGIISLIPDHLFCLLKYPNISWYVEGELVQIRDPFKRRFKAVFVLCSLKTPEPPRSVTISTDTSFDSASFELEVKIVQEESVKRNFTVCLSPLHSLFNESMRLLEWLEINIKLGVERIYVYVNSCSQEVMTILEMHQIRQYVVIQGWPLPGMMCENETLVHYCGQSAAVNECLYRAKGDSRYISVLDLDEFIVPQKAEHMVWNDMFNSMSQNDVYIFRNAFFVGNFSRTDGPITQSYFFRRNYIHEAPIRSKFIAVTQSIVTMGVHSPFEMTGTTYIVNPSFGLLHHYRYTSMAVDSQDDVENRVMEKYASHLNNMQTSRKEILRNKEEYR